MKKIRIKNDIRVSWGITTNGKQVSLAGNALEVSLVVYNRVIPITDFTVTQNVISFVFLGEQQKICGAYTVVCKDRTNNNLNVIDKTDAFELVPHTEDEGGTNNPNVALEVVTLSTDRDSSTIGKAATISVGEVKTLPAGSQAYVTNTGTVNDAVLNFGIPSGSNGDNGTDGNGIVAEPSSVTFNVDDKGHISSEQDKLIRMKAYIGGVDVGDAEIVKISATNFKNVPNGESDGCSFYLRGSYLDSVTTTDLDGNTVNVPVTQAQLEVTCKMPESSLQYTTNVRVFVNTQNFYTSLISNQREFKQTFTEINNQLTDQGTELEKYYSEWQQTARSLSYTITKNKQETDGSIEEISNRFESTASSLSSTIEANKSELNGTIENLKSEFKQTTEEISSTVEKNKTAADGSIESLRSEFKQTTDGITSTVESNKKDADGKIDKLGSQIKQTSDSVSIISGYFYSDGTLRNTSGLLTTADKAELASRSYVDGKVVSEATISTMIINGIATADIDADQINFTGHRIDFTAGDLTITSDGFTLDRNGNAKFSGDITANSIRLKISPVGNVLGGALLLGGGSFTLPPLSVGECVNLKIVSPLITRSSPAPTLVPGNSTVMLWYSGNASDLPTNSNMALGNGAYDLVGYNSSGTTYWVVSK